MQWPSFTQRTNWLLPYVTGSCTGRCTCSRCSFPASPASVKNVTLPDGEPRTALQQSILTPLVDKSIGERSIHSRGTLQSNTTICNVYKTHSPADHTQCRDAVIHQHTNLCQKVLCKEVETMNKTYVNVVANNNFYTRCKKRSIVYFKVEALLMRQGRQRGLGITT
jgi:hypothetical protein